MKAKKVQMNLQLVTTANANFIGKELDEMDFKLNRFRAEIKGSITDNFSFQYRQSFNKYSNPYAVDNLSASLEKASVMWRPNPKFKFIIGKQFVDHGGYEYYVNAQLVREYSEFNNLLTSYQAGLTAGWQLNENHEINLQVVNNRTKSIEELYPTGLPEGVGKSKIPFLHVLNWNGLFFNKMLQLRYAVAQGRQSKEDRCYYLTFGHSLETKHTLTYLDVMFTHQGLDQHGMISRLPSEAQTAENTEYLSFIGSFDYRFNHKWNAYAKGAYETARVCKTNGDFQKGLYRTSWNVQGSLEYAPSRKMDLFFFILYTYRGVCLKDVAVAMGASEPDTHRFSLGLVYTIPVF